MSEPNPRLGDVSPADAIGTRLEQILRNLLRAAKQGCFS